MKINLETLMNPKTLMRAVLISAAILSARPIDGLAAESKQSILDQPLKNFKSSEGRQIFSLCQAISVPCGVEESKEESLTDSGDVVDAAATTPRQILDSIQKKHKSYAWDFSNGMIHLRYTGKGSPLDQKIPKLAIKDTLSFRAVGEVLKSADIKAGTSLVGDPRYGVVSVRGQDISVREALDRIAKADGKVVWHFRFSTADKGNDFGLFTWHANDGESLLNWRPRKRFHGKNKDGGNEPKSK